MSDLANLTVCCPQHRAPPSDGTRPTLVTQTCKPKKDFLIDKKIEMLSEYDPENIKTYDNKLKEKPIFRLCHNDVSWTDDFWINLPNPKTTIVTKTEIKQTVLSTDIQLELDITRKEPSQLEETLEIKQIQPEQIVDLTQILENHPKSDNHKLLLRKYFDVWGKTVGNAQRNVVKYEKNVTIEKKVDDFIENIRSMKNKVREKSDVVVKKRKDENVVASFTNRFKAQKSMIEQQKAMIQEQKRIIEELKLNKIRKEVKESLANAVKEFRKTAADSSNLKYKAKPEIISEELEMVLHPGKLPKILQQMEARALEREEKRLLIKERKKLIDEEKKRLAEEAVQKKLKDELDDKENRLQLLKQQRERVRQMEIEKQEERKRMTELFRKAENHCRQQLKKKSLEHFKLGVKRIRIRLEIAESYHENSVVIRCFRGWRTTTREIKEEKRRKADEFWKGNMQKRCLNIWKRVRFDSILRQQVAVDRYEMSLQTRIFIAWHKIVCEYHILRHRNLEKARKHYRRYLLFQCFHYWTTFPAVIQIEKERNEKKQKWRLKVAEVLSDYDPRKCVE